MTPPARPGSLPLAPAQRHPAPRWPCPPRTGPRRHHRWLPRAVGGAQCFQSCYTIPCRQAHSLPVCSQRSPREEGTVPPFHPCWCSGALPCGGHASAIMSPGWHRQDGDTWRGCQRSAGHWVRQPKLTQSLRDRETHHPSLAAPPRLGASPGHAARSSAWGPDPRGAPPQRKKAREWVIISPKPSLTICPRPRLPRTPKPKGGNPRGSLIAPAPLSTHCQCRSSVHSCEDPTSKFISSILPPHCPQPTVKAQHQKHCSLHRDLQGSPLPTGLSPDLGQTVSQDLT